MVVVVDEYISVEIVCYFIVSFLESTRRFAAPDEEVLGSIPAVAARSLLVGSVSV